MKSFPVRKHRINFSKAKVLQKKLINFEEVEKQLEDSKKCIRDTQEYFFQKQQNLIGKPNNALVIDLSMDLSFINEKLPRPKQ